MEHLWFPVDLPWNPSIDIGFFLWFFPMVFLWIFARCEQQKKSRSPATSNKALQVHRDCLPHSHVLGTWPKLVRELAHDRGWDWCPFSGDFEHHQSKYLLEIRTPIVGWCLIGTFTKPCMKGIWSLWCSKAVWISPEGIDISGGYFLTDGKSQSKQQ